MFEVNEKSHVDHGVDIEEVKRLMPRATFAVKTDGFIIATVEVEKPVPCALVGPATGRPVPKDIFMAKRGTRPNESRMTREPATTSQKVTVIAGGSPLTLYTAYGGPLAPKEPTDPYLKTEEKVESEAFWSQHALAASAFGL